jgi:methyltransferase
MNWALVLVLAVALERGSELLIARRNSTRLLKAGGVEHATIQVPMFVVLNIAWLLTMFWLAWHGAALKGVFVALYGLLSFARIWVMTSLGRFWTVRVITIPGAPLVKRGPYRYFRHPNYLVVIGEIAVLPLALGSWRLAVLFTILNVALIATRVRVEDRALASHRG